MEKEPRYDLHFVMNRGMKEKILGVDIFEGTKSLSGIVVRILKLMVPVLAKEQKWGEQKMSRYMPVCDDPDEVRDHVHVYVPDGLYRELKLLHQELNVYSIAQLLRGFLEFFLGMVERFRGGVFQVLEKIFDRWKEEEKAARLTTSKKLQQLSQIIKNLPGKNRLIKIYDHNYSPFWTLRL